MNRPLRRAGAYALLSLLALAAPTLGRLAAVPFAAVAVAAYFVTDGRAFDLFAYPWDERAGRLETLLGFSLAATGLSVVYSVGSFDLPLAVYVATLLAVGFGDLGRVLALDSVEDEAAGAAGFGVLGFAAATAGQLAVAQSRPAIAVFLAASGVLLAALLRSVFTEKDDPLVILSVALLLWLFADLHPDVGAVRVGVAIAATVVFGYLSYATGAASVAGMLTGVFLGLLAVVLGGYGWFVVLMAFFGVGGLSTKFRYDEKTDRGVAEGNSGARGTGNVLGNSAAALAALLLYAASPGLPVPSDVFLFAFAASVATALADTLSSEIGGLYGPPRLITTLEPVDPGTDGAVTWQGELAGLAGAALIALLALALTPLDAVDAVVVLVGGIAGMTMDSLAGATIEGDRLGNQSVNFLATLTGGVAGGLLALAFGLA
ncbi:DUF92 domain-containing protein [Halocalculus aciditolerans]|uniref:DUF92 domain-containing protein n=1 Tax=Halocalculus aciditolerans TaxID=1383812 RepID=UPI0016659B50|nr:DUF92 domain-containing protein [Halocalculus aciditolerans]